MVVTHNDRISEWPDGSFIQQEGWSVGPGKIIPGGFEVYCGTCKDERAGTNERTEAFLIVHEHQIRHLGEELAKVRAVLEGYLGHQG